MNPGRTAFQRRLELTSAPSSFVTGVPAAGCVRAATYIYLLCAYICMYARGPGRASDRESNTATRMHRTVVVVVVAGRQRHAVTRARACT